MLYPMCIVFVNDMEIPGALKGFIPKRFIPKGFELGTTLS